MNFHPRRFQRIVTIRPLLFGESLFLYRNVERSSIDLRSIPILSSLRLRCIPIVPICVGNFCRLLTFERKQRDTSLETRREMFERREVLRAEASRSTRKLGKKDLPLLGAIVRRSNRELTVRLKSLLSNSLSSYLATRYSPRSSYRCTHARSTVVRASFPPVSYSIGDRYLSPLLSRLGSGNVT